MAAIANLLFDSNQIEIVSKLYLYGSQATELTGQNIVDEINRMYNEPEALIRLGDQKMTVVFKVTFEVINEGDVADLTRTNRNFQNNFIRIESKNLLTRSFMGFGLGDNVGHWLTTDQLGVSTTAAHEFGHGLGLDHPIQTDYRGINSPPPIMAPRGSLVDPQYQWNPLAKAGEFGGTMNPKYRKVTVQEIELIIDGISFDHVENNLIGRISNTLFNETGNPVERLS